MNPSVVGLLLLVLGVPSVTFWPYFTGAVLTLLGVGVFVIAEIPRRHGMGRVVAFGRVLFAVPMAVFGAEHFVFTDSLVGLVPSWLPAHLFWVYLTGTCLIAAGLSIVAKRVSGLAAMLLGVELLSFVLLIWLPGFASKPGNRFALTVLLRETAFSSGSFAIAFTDAFPPLLRRSKVVIPMLRFGIGVPVVVFGVEHFLHPAFVPVVPLELPMPAWVPFGLAIAYATGVALVVCGAAIVLRYEARLAATVLGTVINIVIVLVYLPLIIVEPSVEVGLNYLADTLAFGGAVLALAAALGRESGGEKATH